MSDDRPSASALDFALTVACHHAICLRKQGQHHHAEELSQLARWLERQINALHPGPWLLVRLTTQRGIERTGVEVIERGGFSACAARFGQLCPHSPEGWLRVDEDRAVRLAILEEVELDCIVHGMSDPIGHA